MAVQERRLNAGWLEVGVGWLAREWTTNDILDTVVTWIRGPAINRDGVLYVGNIRDTHEDIVHAKHLVFDRNCKRELGYVTNHGQFIGRRLAWDVARDAGQLTDIALENGTLFPEIGRTLMSDGLQSVREV
jgi:hypothetical protein